MSAWVDRIAARPWWAFIAWAAIIGGIHGAIWSGVGWPYFVDGAHLLFSSDAGHLYATHSELQIGPLTFVVASPLVFALPTGVGKVVAMVLMSAAGVVVLAELRKVVPYRDALTNRAYLLAGLCFMTVWEELAVTWAHLDDVLTLLLTAIGLRLLRSGSAIASAVALALAVDCKPWALAFVPLLLLVEHGHRVKAVAVYAGVVLVAWLPFVLVDSHTLSASAYRIANSPASSLRVLGVHTAGTPSWDRPLQLLLGIALAFVLVRRRRWAAVILVVVAVRLLLDPSVKSYYDAGLLAGSLLCDLLLLGGPLPVLSLSAIFVFYLPMFPLHSMPHTYGVIRTVYLVTVIAAVTLMSDSALRDPRHPASTLTPASV